MQRFLLALLFFVLPAPLFAASLFVDGNKTIGIEGNTTISIHLDTEGQTINAVEGEFSLSGNAQIVDVKDSASVVGFWVEPLSVTHNTVHISGIIPGGFNGEGELLSLIVTGTTEGSAILTLGPLSLFEDDGLGTEKIIPLSETTLSVVLGTTSIEKSDTQPPEEFSVGIINVSDTAEKPLYAAIFATNDRQSGIDRYEIQETNAKEPDITAWKVAESPYVLSDQSRSGKIFVRAIDNAGNSRESEYKTEQKGGMIQIVFGAILLIVLFLFFFIRRNVFPKTKNR